jgi:hypothetical protein
VACQVARAERVAVRRRASRALDANRASSAGEVFHDKRLAEHHAHTVRDNPRDQVCHRAWPEWHD